jgi:hypothetical protein
MSRISASWPVAGDGLRMSSGESAEFPTSVKEVMTLLVQSKKRGQKRVDVGCQDRVPPRLEAKAAAHAAGFIGGVSSHATVGDRCVLSDPLRSQRIPEHRHAPGATAQGTRVSSALRQETSPRGVDRRDTTGGAWRSGISQAKRALAPMHRRGRGPLTRRRGHAMLAHGSHTHWQSGASGPPR